MRYVRLFATPVTLLLLVGVLALGAWWGYKAVITPTPPTPPPPCVQKTVGKALKSTDVTVNVYNGGGVRGAAGDVSKVLVSRGFIKGKVENADDNKTTYVIGADVNNPEVKLVAAQFVKVEVRADQRPDHTVDVVIGRAKPELATKAPTTLPVQSDTVCLPSSSTPTPTPTPTR